MNTKRTPLIMFLSVCLMFWLLSVFWLLLQGHQMMGTPLSMKARIFSITKMELLIFMIYLQIIQIKL